MMEELTLLGVFQEGTTLTLQLKKNMFDM
jgi:hypothetical protein